MDWLMKFIPNKKRYDSRTSLVIQQYFISLYIYFSIIKASIVKFSKACPRQG